MSLFHPVKRLVGLGILRLIDDAGGIQRVQVDVGPTGPDGKSLQLRDDTPLMQHFGVASHPPRGSDAVLIALGGDANQMVVVATTHRDYRMKALPEGAVALYTTGDNYIKLLPDGSIESVGDWTHTGTLTVTGDTTVHGQTLLDGDLEVTGDTLLDQDLGVSGDAGVDGDLEVLGDITDRAGSNTVTLFTLRFKYNAHAHGGIQVGSAGNFTLVSNQLAT